MNRLIFDVESAKTTDQVGGWGNVGQMGIGVAVVYSELSDGFRLYGQSDAAALQRALLAADEISGYNIWGFDLPLIFQMGKKQFWESSYARILESKVYDLFRLVCRGLGRNPNAPPPAGWDLNSLAINTLNSSGKTEDGGQAPGMFQRGEFVRLHSYCLEDVRLERDVIRFAQKFGYVIGADAKRCPVSTGRLPRRSEPMSLCDPLWGPPTAALDAAMLGGATIDIKPGEAMPAGEGEIPLSVFQKKDF